MTLAVLEDDKPIKLDDEFFNTKVENRSRENELDLEMFEEYCIGYNFLESTESFHDDLQPVTLVTHATSDMLKTLENLPSMWDGPISVGLFLDIQSENALKFLAATHKCFPDFQRKVSIHIAFRIAPFQKSCPSIPLPQLNVSCENFIRNKKSLLDSIPGPFTLYPCSLMRNVARKGAQSDLHFIIDGDMVVSEGMAQKVKPIANKMLNGRDKNVLLVRRFESSNGTVIPKSVGELERSLAENRTFEFHHEFFPIAHKIDDLSYWLKYSVGSSDITYWPVSYTSQLWEPQPILHRNDPYNAAYFPARLKNMQSLIYKLCRADYTFHLVSHVFNVHEGVKVADTVYSQAVADHQKVYARDRAQKRFIREMDHLYPSTINKCGTFDL